MSEYETPFIIQTRADELEERIAATLADEETLLTEVTNAERESDKIASKAYLEGKPIKPTPSLDSARNKLRACRLARIELMNERDILAGSLVQAKVDELTGQAKAINDHREKVIALASALNVITARLWKYSIDSAGGSYEINGRITNCGMLSNSDLPNCHFAPDLMRIGRELRAYGVKEADSLCRPNPKDIPGGQQLIGKPIVDVVRQLVARIEGDLRASDLFPKEIADFVAQQTNTVTIG